MHLRRLQFRTRRCLSKSFFSGKRTIDRLRKVLYPVDFVARQRFVSIFFCQLSTALDRVIRTDHRIKLLHVELFFTLLNDIIFIPSSRVQERETD